MTLPLDDKFAASLVGRSAIYGIRPEHIRLADPGVSVMVKIVEPTGPKTQVLAQMGGDEVLGVFRECIAVALGTVIGIFPDVDQVQRWFPHRRWFVKARWHTR